MPTKPSTFRMHKKESTAHRPCDRWRGNASGRGYDGDWKKLSESFKEANPICYHCNRRGIANIGVYADHIVPLNGKDDPLRLRWDNLQTLCASCHAFKTKQQNDYPRFHPACRVVVVYGPPAAGKTTFVQEQLKTSDIVWDWDAEISAVGGDRTDPQWAVDAVKNKQQSFYRSIRQLHNTSTAWIIQAWRDRALQMRHGMDAELVVIATDAEACIERINRDGRRSIVREQQVRAVKVWHDENDRLMIR